LNTQDIIEYFKAKGCHYYYEYNECYGNLDLKDKIIIHIGGDCGSSSYFFIKNGAKYVIFYEKDKELLKKYQDVCRELNFCDKVEAREEWKAGDYPNGDIFIMDCEGCEENINFNELLKYKLICIAVHSWTTNKAYLLRKMYNWYLKYVSDDGQELMFCLTRNT